MDFDLNKMKTDPIIQYTHASDAWFDELKISFCCWLGFILTSMLPNYIFSKKNFSSLLAAWHK